MSVNATMFEQSVIVPLNDLIVLPFDASILVKFERTLQVAPGLRVSMAFTVGLEDVNVLIAPTLLLLIVRADVTV